MRVEARDHRERFREARQLYVPSFNHTHWADLVSMKNPGFVVPDYGSGLTEAEAVRRARQRYGSEQT